MTHVRHLLKRKKSDHVQIQTVSQLFPDQNTIRPRQVFKPVSTIQWAPF